MTKGANESNEAWEKLEKEFRGYAGRGVTSCTVLLKCMYGERWELGFEAMDEPSRQRFALIALRAGRLASKSPADDFAEVWPEEVKKRAHRDAGKRWLSEQADKGVYLGPANINQLFMEHMRDKASPFDIFELSANLCLERQVLIEQQTPTPKALTHWLPDSDSYTFALKEIEESVTHDAHPVIRLAFLPDRINTAAVRILDFWAEKGLASARDLSEVEAFKGHLRDWKKEILRLLDSHLTWPGARASLSGYPPLTASSPEFHLDFRVEFWQHRATLKNLERGAEDASPTCSGGTVAKREEEKAAKRGAFMAPHIAPSKGKLTLNALAEKTGIAQSSLSRWYNGLSKLGDHNLGVLADYLKEAPEQIPN